MVACVVAQVAETKALKIALNEVERFLRKNLSTSFNQDFVGQKNCHSRLWSVNTEKFDRRVRSPDDR